MLTTDRRREILTAAIDQEAAPTSMQTWTIFTGIRMKAGDRVKIQRLDNRLRQERPLQRQRCNHHRSDEVVLTVAVGYLKILIGRVLLTLRELEQDHALGGFLALLFGQHFFDSRARDAAVILQDAQYV